jgi:hypothetical protein
LTRFDRFASIYFFALSSALRQIIDEHSTYMAIAGWLLRERGRIFQIAVFPRTTNRSVMSNNTKNTRLIKLTVKGGTGCPTAKKYYVIAILRILRTRKLSFF